ncbi:IS66 family transposase [Candidatus Peregrinibacteria bacterium]|nr:IS66 family transposase [Candidatus Peregrinibacteria bacterium]
MILKHDDRIAALEKNSSNSSKPPSSDIGPPKRNQSLRQPTGRPSGGQYGHVGNTRTQVETPDTVIACRPESCTSCGTSLRGVPGLTWEKRQVADIPPLHLSVTEFQKESVSCPGCGTRSTGIFPEHVSGSFQFGNHFKSMIVYLSVVHHLPFDRLTLLVKDLLHINPSEGTVETILSRAESLGIHLQQEIVSIVKQGSWAGSDETGIRVKKDTWWQWVWQHSLATLYVVDPSRGYSVVKEHFGEDYAGTLVHDCWSAQNNTTAAHHQLCHAHLIRDLNFCLDTDKSPWAYVLKELLLSSEKARTHIWADGFDPIIRAAVINRYNRRLGILIAQKVAGRESRRLQKRFKKHQDKIFHFLTQPDIPFHNNGSERAIRNAKVKKKVSGCFRSEHGARRHALLLSIVETCKKQGRDVFDSLQLLFEGTLSFQGG